MTPGNVIIFIGSGAFLVQLYSVVTKQYRIMKEISTAFLDNEKLRHSPGRPSRSDFVQLEFVEFFTFIKYQFDWIANHTKTNQ